MSSGDNGASYHSVYENISQSTFYNTPSNYVVTITKHNYIPKVIYSSAAVSICDPVISGSTKIVCNTNYTYTLDANSTQNATSFYWYTDYPRVIVFSNNSGSTCTGKAYFSGDGYLYCDVSNACGTYTDDIHIRVLGLVLLLSPNPSSGETVLTIESSSVEDFDENVEWDYEIYDPNLKTKAKKDKIKGNKCAVDLNGWEKGVYIVKVNYKDIMLTNKLIVE